jgi:carboxylesterase type B
MQQFPGANGEVIQSNVKKIFGTYGEKAPEESEDCLYLNIYAPPPTANKRPKPVMFWIFGGNLQFGSASLERYNGGCLAARNDVIVVTINYRLNIFGFANSPELSRGTQNAGFLDQRRALLWVQENIAAFGGDPAKVLLFGESAGAYSVKQLLANPTPHEPLPFAAAIMQSQQSGHGAKSDLAWDRVVLHFGCQDRMSHLGCLREVPAQALKDFIETHYVTFGPVQEDGTSTMDVRKSINSGTFAKVPMLIGTNANEARAFEAFIGMEKGSALLDFVQKWFRVPNTSHLTQHFESVLQTPAMDRYRAVDECAANIIPCSTTWR